MAESFVYMTCETPAEADAIGEVLVERRLAACVNIIDGMRSKYWWDGKIQTGNESVLVAKTTSGLVEELIQAVKAMHGYEVPCIVAVPIENGNIDFLEWVRKETRKA